MKRPSFRNNPLIRRARAAFTLIELLVVVSIIALLIAILLPALSAAKATAEAAACAANLKAMQTGLSVYLAQTDDQFPPNGIIFPKMGSNVYKTPLDANENAGPTGNWNQQNWRPQNGALYAMVNSNLKVYMCPTDFKANGYRTYAQTPQNPSTTPLLADYTKMIVNPMDPTPATPSMPLVPYIWKMTDPGEQGQGYWSYSVNAVLNSQAAFLQLFPTGGIVTPPLKVTSIRNPTFITFVEEAGAGAIASPFNDEVFDPPAYNGGDKISDRHNFSGNVAFIDGHVDTYKAVVFNYAPLSVDGNGNVDNLAALSYPTTALFFPDNGAFAYGQ